MILTIYQLDNQAIQKDVKMKNLQLLLIFFVVISVVSSLPA